ncbi:unnamed protein product [Gadus morhua 'NCC']
MAEGTESLKVNLESAEADWKETKDRMLSLPLDERRRFYRTRCYTSLDQVPVWSPSPGPSSEHQRCPRNKKLDGRISLYTGDITQLEVDAIVNADAHPVNPFTIYLDQLATERLALKAEHRAASLVGLRVTLLSHQRLAGLS